MRTTELEQPPAPEISLTTQTGPPPPATSARPTPRKFVAHTHYVIDWKAQLRGSVWSVLIVIGMLVLVNVMLYHLGSVNTADVASQQLKDLFNRGDNTRRTAVVVLSVVFLLGFVLLRILETHKVHGAACNLHRRLRQLTEGRYNIFTQLRRGDELQQLAQATNELAGALRERARQNVQNLEELGARAAAFGPEAQDLTDALGEMLARERALVE